jgi:hypothetical protein
MIKVAPSTAVSMNDDGMYWVDFVMNALDSLRGRVIDCFIGMDRTLASIN